MTTMAYQITSLTVVYSTVYSDADQRKPQSSASLAFVWGNHRDRWIPRTEGQLRRKCFHLMTSSCIYCFHAHVCWSIHRLVWDSACLYTHGDENITRLLLFPQCGRSKCLKNPSYTIYRSRISVVLTNNCKIKPFFLSNRTIFRWFVSVINVQVYDMNTSWIRPYS